MLTNTRRELRDDSTLDNDVRSGSRMKLGPWGLEAVFYVEGGGGGL